MSGPSRGLTLFAHVCNEALMLPYWLRHHRHLFDHGVIVDRGSTDGTLDILRELVPDWEVVSSRNPVFDARDCDREMMALEACHDGWKIILNVTEFLFHDDLRGYLADFERAHPEVSSLAIPMAVMVDPREMSDVPPDPEVALWRQRSHGVPPAESAWSFRYLHRERDGAYTAGRHGSRHASRRDEQLLILRYSWSPYVIVRQRAPLIQSASAAADMTMGLGYLHLVTPEQLDAHYAEWALRAVDLREEPRYRRIHERMIVQDASAPALRPRSTRLALAPQPERPVHVVIGGPRTGALAQALATQGASDAFALNAIVLGLEDFSETPDCLFGDALIILDMSTEVRAEWQSASALDGARVKPGGNLRLVQMLARADYFIFASDALRDAWLPCLRHAGRIGASVPGPDVLAVVPDPMRHEDMAPIRRFLANPVRRGVPAYAGRAINVSEESYRLQYRSLLQLIEQVGLLAAENARLRQEQMGRQQMSWLLRCRRWLGRLLRRVGII